MTLNNQNLIALSKFALKAKRHIGLVMTKEMTNNQHYANDILIKATLSEDRELIDLTKKISVELNVGVEVIAAIESYINSLIAKGASDQCILNSKHFLGKLAQNIAFIPADGASYRQVVQSLLPDVAIENRAFSINLAREFYAFWINENVLADAISDADAETQKQQLVELWNNIEQEFFSDAEIRPLNTYTDFMRKVGVSERDVNIRQKIAKFLTVELRYDDDNPEDTYRDAINRTQHLFLKPDLKAFFLIVSREFYRFWIDHAQNKRRGL
jgi:hypothetical protein